MLSSVQRWRSRERREEVYKGAAEADACRCDVEGSLVI
jgi:hypothetical protein